jgi:1,2-diacylglycerol 3-alpha-glucosyltransferase
MRIGMMLETYKPYISGVTNFVALYKRHLESLGHEVFVFTFGNRKYKDVEPHVFRAPGFPLAKTGFYLGFGYPRRIRSLVATMDVVHVHHPFLSGILSWRICRARRIPIVFTNHTRYDLYSRFYLPFLPRRFARRLLSRYMAWFYRLCDLVVVPSEGARRFLQEIGGGYPIETVPNGVDLTPFYHIDRTDKRAELGFASQDVVLTFVGRLGEEKNLYFLLDAFAAVSSKTTNVKLMLIGGGPLRGKLQSHARRLGVASRVSFTGLVPYEQLPQYLSAADAFVTASVTEVHPLTVIEAMAAGLPVLGIDSPGISDTVQDGETGYIVPEIREALAARMVDFVQDPARRVMMGKQAQEVSRAYAIERTTQTMLAHYQRLIERARGGQS